MAPGPSNMRIIKLLQHHCYYWTLQSQILESKEIKMKIWYGRLLTLYFRIQQISLLTQAPNPKACSNIIQVPLSPGFEYKILTIHTLDSVNTVPDTEEAEVNFSKTILSSWGQGVPFSLAVQMVYSPVMASLCLRWLPRCRSLSHIFT